MIEVLLGITSLIAIASSTALFVSVKRNLLYMDTLDEIEATIVSAVKALEEQKVKIGKKAQIEVLSDEPVVKELIRDIVVAKNVVADIAKLLDDTVEREAVPNEDKES